MSTINVERSSLERVPISSTAVMANLLRKELRESRPMLVVGLWTFWLMPAILEWLYALFFSWRGEFLAGFAWVLVAAAGWFFTILVAAHSVCRDWGKVEEHFLLAKPVTVAQVLLAKLVSALCVVAVVLVLFAAAMGEVGNSLPIRAAKSLVDTTHRWGDLSKAVLNAVARRDDVFFIGMASSDHSHRGLLTPRPLIARFHVDNEGQIQDVQRYDVPMALGQHVEVSCFLIIDLRVEPDDIITMVALQRARNIGHELWRMQLREVSMSSSGGSAPQVTVDRLVDLPGLESDEPLRFTSSVVTDRYLYGVYAFRDKDDRYQRKLLVFAYKQGLVAVVVQELTLDRYTRLFLDRRKLRVMSHQSGNHWQVAEFDADGPSTLADSTRWEGRFITMPSYHWPSSEFFSNNQSDTAASSLSAAIGGVGARSGWGAMFPLQSAVWDQNRQVAYLSDVLGVRAVRQSESLQWRVIGEYRASPLAMQFRRDWSTTPRMLLFDQDLLLEYNDGGLTAIDISDPSRLRRAGFAMGRYQWHDPRIHATRTHFVLFGSQWVHVIDRPRTK